MIIGDFKLPEGEILAPMAGISDSPYRRLTRRFGSGLLYSECISAEGLRRLGRKSLELVSFHPEERPIAIQLFGSEPQAFREAAEIVRERFNPEMIDINCGCPVRKMVTRNSGGYLMQFPELIGKIVEAAGNGSKLPVSVKLRSGWSIGDETAPEAAIAAEEAGASLVAIHARYVRNAWKTPADWDVIGRVKNAVRSIPVVGNGDVSSRRDVRRMKEVTGCDRVMIGRGSFGNPWIFRKNECSLNNEHPDYQPSLEERLEIIHVHYNLMLEDFDEYHTVRRMRKHFPWYIRGLPGATEARRVVMKLDSVKEVFDLLKNCFTLTS